MQSVACAVGQKRPLTAAAASGMGMAGVNRVTGAGMMGMPSDETEDDALEAEEEARSSGARGGKAAMPRIRVGNRHLTMGTELVEMTDSTDLFKADDFAGLRARLEEQGFLFLRGVIPPSTIAAARQKMLVHLRDKGAMREGTRWEDAFIEYQRVWDAKEKARQASEGGAKKRRKADPTAATASAGMMASTPATPASLAGGKMIPGWTVDAESGGLVGGREADDAVDGWREIGNSRELTDVYDGHAMRTFYQRLFEQDSSYAERPHLKSAGVPSFTTLPSCTWLRAKGPGEVTAEHADYYYFYKNTDIFSELYSPAQNPSKEQAKVLREQQARIAKQTEEQRETCQICHSPEDAETTLLCDLCGCGFHMRCLRPVVDALPSEEQEWHCHTCTNHPLDYWTCWTALGDISGHDGRLALIPASHRLGGYEAAVRPDLLPRDFTRAYEAAAQWQTPTEIRMGDIILFNMKTIHAATRNGSEKFRLSLDTRVTSCKGRRFLQKHGLDSLDAQPKHAVAYKTAAPKKSPVQVAAVEAATTEATISSAFRSRKPQKMA